MKALGVGDTVRIAGGDPDDLGTIRGISPDGFDIEWLNGSATMPLENRARLEWVPDPRKTRYVATVKYQVEFHYTSLMMTRADAIAQANSDFADLKLSEGWESPDKVSAMVWQTPGYVWHARFYWDE